MSQTPDFCFGISIVERAIILATERWRSERDKFHRRRSTKLITPPSSDSRPLQSITCDRQALSTARYSRAGQLATADTCTFPVSVYPCCPCKEAVKRLFLCSGAQTTGSTPLGLLVVWICHWTEYSMHIMHTDLASGPVGGRRWQNAVSTPITDERSNSRTVDKTCGAGARPGRVNGRSVGGRRAACLPACPQRLIHMPPAPSACARPAYTSASLPVNNQLRRRRRCRVKEPRRRRCCCCCCCNWHSVRAELFPTPENVATIRLNREKIAGNRRQPRLDYCTLLFLDCLPSSAFRSYCQTFMRYANTVWCNSYFYLIYFFI